MAQRESLGGQHVLDLDQACLAEILAGKDFRLAGPSQVAEGVDAHFLQAIAAADREFEVADREAHHQFDAVALLLLLLFRSQITGRGGILEEQACPRVVGDGFENPAVTLLGLGEIIAVFVHDAEVEQRPEGCGVTLERTFVAGLRLLVVAGAVVENSQRKQGVRMARVDGDGLLEHLHDLAGGAAAVGQDRPFRRPIVGRLAGRVAILARCHGVDGFVGFVVMAGGPQGIGRSRAARDGVVARLLCRLERLLCLVERLQGDVGKALVEEGHRAAVGGPQRVERLAVTAQQILADTQSHRCGRAAVGHLLQFADRSTHVAMSGRVVAEGLCQATDFRGAERPGAGDELADVDRGGNFCGGDHEWPFNGRRMLSGEADESWRSK